MLINLLLILLILAGVAYGLYRYYLSLSNVTETSNTDDDFTDIDTLTKKVVEQFSMMQRMDLREKNITKTEFERQEKQRSELRIDLKNAGYGDTMAIRNIKAYISAMLLTEHLGFGVNEKTIDEIIPFNKPKELKNQEKFEILLYYYTYKKEYVENNRIGAGKNGFVELLKDYDILSLTEVDGEMMYDFSSDKLNEIYEVERKNFKLTFQDKVNILTQRIFEKFKGPSSISMILEQSVDEVDIGVSGVPVDGYDISDSKNLSYSFKSIWVMVKGIKLRLSCIGFESQEDLQRVAESVYKYGANKTLTRKSGYVVSAMKDGSRVNVTRPPFTGSFTVCIRKFGSVESVAPEKLIVGENSETVRKLIWALVRGYMTIGITGGQGVGKSTMLKSIVSFIPAYISLMVQEITAELNLQYAFPNRKIMNYQETESLSSQDALNNGKKSNSDITIIGEDAEAIQSRYVIQASQVASRCCLFTHHAKTAYDFVTAIANDLLDPVVGIYRDKKEAIEACAKVLNIDIHLAKFGTKRSIERITEIIPCKEELYPSEVNNSQDLKEDMKEFMRRQTDRKLFKTVDLIRFDGEKFIVCNMPSEDMCNRIRQALSDSDADRAKFEDILVEMKRQLKQGDQKTA